MVFSNFFIRIRWSLFSIQAFVGLIAILIMVSTKLFEGYYAEPEPSGTRAILDLEMEKVRLNVTFESRIKYPILMWWTEGMSLTRGPKKCPGGETCLFTKRKEYVGHPMTKAVFFYGSFFEPESMKLPLPRPQGIEQFA